jgi:ADP-heptose:LPS heptosyltransferase
MVYSLFHLLELVFTEKSYDLPTVFNSESFFYNSFRAIFDNKDNPETVKIKVYGHLVKSIRTLLFHHSQQEIETHEKYSPFFICI